ncbi:pyrimidine 5-nucleotidase [Trichodelitschia bisporula]|uniref:Pyrimidine 5-nucleotidase n=1 Tax=Trichodelitschia bisporula TaxID=703511 RepID=A0A6G1I207_9PEZI|nr:pyrimidine 5-nucleotidase [Trichodelitschia bisporula]
MASNRPVLFVDIDNCLYPKSTRILHMMQRNIEKYFETHLELPLEDAKALHRKYYTQYGLALEGLVRHHTVDPLDFNAKVDDALPLEDVLKPDPKLRELLEDADKTKVRLWLFTNAYVNHGKRVVRLLGVDDLFEGITFCDYGASEFIAKPRPAMYEKAMREAGVNSVQDCYFVDDSHLNAKKAAEFGWTAVHLVEASDPLPAEQAAQHQIRGLEELRDVFPQFFKTTGSAGSTGNPVKDS